MQRRRAGRTDRNPNPSSIMNFTTFFVQAKMAEAEDTLLAKPVEDMADMKELLLSILKPEHRTSATIKPECLFCNFVFCRNRVGKFQEHIDPKYNNGKRHTQACSPLPAHKARYEQVLRELRKRQAVVPSVPIRCGAACTDPFQPCL